MAALKREIEAAMYGTELVKLRIFGQNAQDLDERGVMRKMFFNIDQDNSKSLNENEISSLLGELGLRNMGCVSPALVILCGAAADGFLCAFGTSCLRTTVT